MNLRNLDDLNFRLKVSDIAGLSERAKDRLRLECQINLRFLVNCVLRPGSYRFIPLSERCHGSMIDTFLQPSPELPFDQWSPIKERVVLASRGILKSTIAPGSIDQLILCDPDIRILIISGILSKAKTILDTVRIPFATNEVIRFLFPEWAVDVRDLGGDSFLCPKRDPELNLRDETLSIATFESVKAGGHYEEILFDDCTNEINCSTPEMAEKCEGFYDDTDPLVEPGGYRQFQGTTWSDPTIDLPQVIKRRGLAYKEEHNGAENTSYFEMPVWTLRKGNDEAEGQEINERDRRDQLRPTDVILAWPEKLTASFLFPKYRRNPIKFNLQYLLRYRDRGIGDSFSTDLLLANTRPYADGIPQAYDRLMVMNWDLAGVWSGVRDRSKSDYFCGMASMFELSTRRMFIYDAQLDVFNFSTDVAQAMVKMFSRQLRIGPLEYCDIEDSPGARLLEGEILYFAKLWNVPIQIRWQPMAKVRDAKAIRISRLNGAMKRGLVQFSTSLPYRDEIFQHFERWKPSNRKVKDEGPDCAAQMWEHYSDKIFPNMPETLRPSDNTYWTPEPMAEGEPNPHLDELEYADMELLSRMTCPHAGQ